MTFLWIKHIYLIKYYREINNEKIYSKPDFTKRFKSDFRNFFSSTLLLFVLVTAICYFVSNEILVIFKIVWYLTMIINNLSSIWNYQIISLYFVKVYFFEFIIYYEKMIKISVVYRLFLKLCIIFTITQIFEFKSSKKFKFLIQISNY